VFEAVGGRFTRSASPPTGTASVSIEHCTLARRSTETSGTRTCGSWAIASGLHRYQYPFPIFQRVRLCGCWCWLFDRKYYCDEGDPLFSLTLVSARFTNSRRMNSS
jgi:hypothetical protein